MQRRLSIIILFSILLNLFIHCSYAQMDEKTFQEDIPLEDIGNMRVFINNIEVPILKYNNNSYIKVDILKNYGFNVEHNNKDKIVRIYEDIDLYLKPYQTINYGFDVLIPCKDISVQFIDEEITAFKNSKDEIFININEFYKSSALDLYYDREEKALYLKTYKKHPFRYPQIRTINLNIRDTDILYKNKKIGFIKDGLEMLSMKFILEQTDFINFNSHRNEYSRRWEFKDKDYRVLIWADLNSEITSVGSIYWKDNEIYKKAPLQKPIVSGSDVYLSSIDLMQFFNVIIDYDNVKETAVKDSKDISHGNYFHDSLFHKYNNDVYFIDGKNEYKLYKMTIDDGSSTPITDFPIKNLILHDNKLYFIGTADKTGIYSMDLSNMEIKRIIDMEASYLSIVDNRLYFCNGLEAGWLYSASLEGQEISLIMKRYMKYPIIGKGYVYYINVGDRNCIYRYNLTTKRDYKLINNDVDSMNIDGSHIYFRVHESVYKMKHNGLDCIYFADGIGNDIVIIKDSIYFRCKDSIDIVMKNGEDIKDDGIKLYGIGLIDDSPHVLIDAPDNGKPYLRKFESDMAQELDFNLKSEENQVVSMSYPYVFYKDNDNNLVKYDINTKENMIIIEKLFSKMIGIKDDWLFYIKWGNDGGIYKIKLNGTEDTQLTDKNVARVKLDDDGIYYLKSFMGSIEDFYSIDFNGENRRIIIDDLDQIHFTYEVKNGYIYYPQQNGIYRIKTNGENKKLVVENEGPIYQFTVGDDYLFYLDREIMYRVDLKKFHIKEVKDTIARILGIYDGNVYFVKITGVETGNVYIYNISSDKANHISSFDNYGDIIGFYDNGFLYLETRDEENKIYFVDLKTKDKVLIADKIVDRPIFQEGRLLYISNLGKLDLKVIESKGRYKND